MKKILVVDDSKFTRTFHRRYVENAGCEAIEAAGGQEALALFETHKPDAVIIDLIMPDMDGMDVARQILGKEEKAVIIVCSSDKQQCRKEDALELGCKAFLPKPLNEKQFANLLRELW